MSDKPIVYRVIANGLHVQALRHIRSSSNGWHRYCSVYESDGSDGYEFATRVWYASRSPMSAVLEHISMLSAKMALLARISKSPGTTHEQAVVWLSQIERANVELQVTRSLAIEIAADAGLMESRRAGTPTPPVGVHKAPGPKVRGTWDAGREARPTGVDGGGV